MASQVLSGSSNVSYTNNTGQNVRIVINYMASPTSMSWTGGGSVTATNVLAIGRNLAFNVGTTVTAISTNNASPTEVSESTNFAFPTELMIASGQTFAASCSSYNIIVIPEAG
jgi:hypothetical protein